MNNLKTGCLREENVLKMFHKVKFIIIPITEELNIMLGTR